ncbi:hypothetical protein MMC07_007623, partial [Pseudocyphellaria aurata]|nr:hypothetical protein [Pseudocyphellaria aurata]
RVAEHLQQRRSPTSNSARRQHQPNSNSGARLSICYQAAAALQQRRLPELKQATALADNSNGTPAAALVESVLDHLASGANRSQSVDDRWEGRE